jgi:hypothetical protein
MPRRPPLIPSQIRLRAQAKFSCAFKLIWVVQSGLQKDSLSVSTQISSMICAVPSLRGALAIVTNVGWDAVDADGALDESC